jgi:hypothetical protein
VDLLLGFGFCVSAHTSGLCSLVRLAQPPQLRAQGSPQ